VVGIKFSLFHIHGRDGSVDKELATGWTVWESNPGVGEIFCAVQDGPEAQSASSKIGMGVLPRVMWSELEADHPPPSTAMLRIGRNYTIRGVGLTTLPLSCADCLEILEASCSRSPRDMSSPVMGYIYLYITNYVLSPHCIKLYPSNSLAFLPKIFCGNSCKCVLAAKIRYRQRN
jgi:hypothetical protein